MLFSDCILLFIIGLSICGHEVAGLRRGTQRDRYGSLCLVYGLNEPLDPLPAGTGRECKRSNRWYFENGQFKRDQSFKYCKTFSCPTVSCENPVTDSDGCLRCEDECQWGGRIYPVRQGGLCVDGCNRCTCMSAQGREVVMQTLKGCGDESFCGVRFMP